MLLSHPNRTRKEYNILNTQLPYSPTRNKTFIAGITLLLLTIFDSLFTDFGIKNNIISEANPLMRFVYESSIFGFYFLKISLPIVLLYVITKFELKRYIRILIGITLLLYIFVLFQHSLWITLLFR